MFGKELILDLGNCQALPLQREDYKKFLDDLCELIDMEQEDLHFWDRESDPDGYEKLPECLKGTSLVQFIRTSTIVIHALDNMQEVYINIFSCKDFDGREVVPFCVNFFKGEARKLNSLNRG